jgi:signal transduction histidine kinase
MFGWGQKSGRQEAISLPDLPQISGIFAVVIYFVGFSALAPFYLSQYIYRTMNETVEQAAFMAQLGNLQEAPSARPARETHALPLSGILLSVPEGEPRLIWLVAETEPQPIDEVFVLSDVSRLARVGMVARLFAAPPDSLIALSNPALPGAAQVQAVSSRGIFRDMLVTMFWRLLGPMMIVFLLVALVFPRLVRRAVLRSLDALFVMLYGRKLEPSPDMPDEARGLFASVEQFQESLREHVDEQARLASLGAAASFLAHDVRNLLASLQLNAERLMQMDGEAERRFGRRLENSLQQALALVDWAAMYTSQKRQNIDLRVQNLAPLVAEVQNFVRLHDPHGRVRLVNQVPPELTVLAERTLLFRILYNLSLNGVQAMKKDKDGGELKIFARHENGQCLIRISDTGLGMSRDKAKAALTPHMSGTLPDGTGLGMMIVADLVQWHGGTIELLRSDLNGTHFLISLPLTSKYAPSEQAEQPETEPETEPDIEAANN